MKLTVIWSVCSLIAMLAHLWAAGDAYKDLHVLKLRHLNGSGRFAAIGHMRLALTLALVQALYLALGMLALDGPREQGDTVTLLSLLCLLSAEGLLCLLAVMIVVFRRRLRELAIHAALLSSTAHDIEEVPDDVRE